MLLSSTPVANLILVSTDEFAREKEKVKLEVQMPSFLVFSLLSTSMVVKVKLKVMTISISTNRTSEKTCILSI
jgi:hypothetical protein